ncbi:uronyl 2-sulfotransferase-like [Ciona intestinalis]
MTSSTLDRKYPVMTSVEGGSRVVVYNRVPKCGSTSLLDALRVLSVKLNFHLMSVNYPTLDEHVTYNVQKEIAGMLRFQQNFIYSRHLRFFDIKTFGFGTPIYINIIRDPIDRFVSHYYYSRHGFAKNKGTVNAEWKRSVNEMVGNYKIDHGIYWPTIS